ncbi:YebO family protein [Escherichia coli]
MNEVVNSGVMNIASLVVSVVVLLIGLILWFFINRASSRTNEQIELLEALLDQQKRQNALLRRLCEANEPEKAESKKTVESQKSVEDEDIIRLVAER